MGHFVYTDDERRYVVEAYHKMLIKDIVVRIGHSEDSVLHLIRRMKRNGMISKAKRGFKPPWTDDEIGYLSDNWGLKPTNAIARKLGRSVCGVEGKAHRLRFKKVDSFYTYSSLSRELGRSRASLVDYHRRGWLKGEKASWVCNFGLRPMMFFEEDIVKFLRKHYKLLDIKRIENRYFRNIVKECYG